MNITTLPNSEVMRARRIILLNCRSLPSQSITNLSSPFRLNCKENFRFPSKSRPTDASFNPSPKNFFSIETNMLTRRFIDKEILSVAPPKDRSLKTKSRQKGNQMKP